MSLALMLVATSCEPSEEPSTANTGDPVTPPSFSTALSNWWASNGNRGFFVQAVELRQALSLYSTRWWLQVMFEQGIKPQTKLDVRRVVEWVRPIAYGTGDNTTGDVGLPKIQRLALAIDVLDSVGATIDADKVAEELESLRDGDKYRSGKRGPAGWATTSIAVGIYRKLGMMPPDDVVTNLREHVQVAATDRNASHFSTTAALLTTIPRSIAVKQASVLRRELKWIEGQLSTLPVLARMSIAVSLRPLLKWVQLKPWTTELVCQGLQLTERGASTTAGETPDPHLTANALELGCIAHQQIPPWTTSGWPSHGAIDEALPASVYGLRIARAAGTAEKYSEPLRAQLREVWASDSRLRSDIHAELAAAYLARLLGAPRDPTHGRQEKIEQALGALHSPRSLTPLLLGLATGGSYALPSSEGVRSPPHSKNSTRTPNPLMQAVVFEVAARLTKSAEYHERAVKTLEPWRVPSSPLFRVDPSLGASVTATALGSWVLHKPLPVAALRSAELCDEDYRCVDTKEGGNNLPPLQTAGAAAALANPKIGSFPYVF